MLKTIGTSVKNIMLIFSFVVSLTLVVVVVVLASVIFQLKSQIAAPLIDGLHSSFVGLDEATIDWTIPVRDTIPVRLNIPLQTDTIVTLNESVPLSVNATINLPGIGVLNNARVDLQLPAGLPLPVHLDLMVPVDQTMPISMDVRAVIPVGKTQLHDPLENLQLLFAPLVRVLNNLPDDYGEVGPLVTAVIGGQAPDLLAAGSGVDRAWPGYSQTAGLGYLLASEPVPQLNQPIQTGIVPQGGIPALDQQMRPDVYEAGGPEMVNARSAQDMAAAGIPAGYYDGSFIDAIFAPAHPPVDNVPPTGEPPGGGQPVLISGGGDANMPGGINGDLPPAPTPEGDLGILSSPGG